MPRQVVAKLVAPRTPQIVRRARVLSAIRGALRSGACWVAAPGGYGKTVSVIDYLQKTRAPHIWYRVDDGDQDVASFFHYMAQSVRGARAHGVLPAFGAEYADQLLPFARRFFRACLARLRPGTLMVFDDVQNADVAQFRHVLGILLEELPPHVQCVCISRVLPQDELLEHRVKGRLALIDESVLRFSDREGRALLKMRVGEAAGRIDVAPACGWAAGLVLLAEHGGAAAAYRSVPAGAPAAFAALAGQLIDSLPTAERALLMRLSLLPEVKPEVARALGGSAAAEGVLEALQRRQLLVTRGDSSEPVFHLHDLLRDYLRDRLHRELPAPDLAALMQRTARLLDDAGYLDAAADLALQSHSWCLLRQLISAHAPALLAQGRRATLIDRCAALPPEQLDGWLCYWLGVANGPDDEIAAAWFERGWKHFAEVGDLRGLCLTAAHAVLSKADSWRTHEGLATWTGRAIELIDREVPGLAPDEQLLAWTGMLRAVDFAADRPADEHAVERLAARLGARLASPQPGDTATRRLFASEALIEHAGTTGRRELFELAVDSVAADLADQSASAWARGLWLVAFGAISARYFTYTRRGFPYSRAEDALRAAVDIGQRESLRGVEFGALYHLQLQMKSHNDFTEFSALVERLSQIADSRYTTQVAVVADCEAALHTIRRDFAGAHAACSRFMAAIEAANEPPLERWPHFITKFQVLLASGQADLAADFLTALLPLYTGALRQRTETCVLMAGACRAKWTQDSSYAERLRQSFAALRAANWPAILLNVPHLLAELCADALDLGIDPELCRSLIVRRALVPPARRPRLWPWPVRVHVLGGFSLDRDGIRVDLGPKPPSRSLDIVRVLAVAKDHTCSSQQIYDLLWPDAEGDQAKSAFEQALHRLRRLLGTHDVIVQRGGKLRLEPDKVWVDLDAWESRLAAALSQDPAATEDEIERAFTEFPGPLQHSADEPAASWFIAAAERVRRSYVEVAMRLGRRLEQRGETQKAADAYLRALHAYPTCEPCWEGLLGARLSTGDAAGALDEYRRCERILAGVGRTPSAAIRALAVGLGPGITVQDTSGAVTAGSRASPRSQGRRSPRRPPGQP